MSMKDMEKMKKLIEEKKSKVGFLQEEKKIGVGKVEKMNKNIGLGSTRTKKTPSLPTPVTNAPSSSPPASLPGRHSLVWWEHSSSSLPATATRSIPTCGPTRTAPAPKLQRSSHSSACWLILSGKRRERSGKIN